MSNNTRREITAYEGGLQEKIRLIVNRCRKYDQDMIIPGQSSCWYAPGMLIRANLAYNYLTRAQELLDSIPVHKENGAFHKCFGEFIQIRRLIKEAEHIRKRIEQIESDFREKTISAIHNS